MEIFVPVIYRGCSQEKRREARVGSEGGAVVSVDQRRPGPVGVQIPARIQSVPGCSVRTGQCRGLHRLPGSICGSPKPGGGVNHLLKSVH